MLGTPFNTVIHPQFVQPREFQFFPADAFPTINPVHWLVSHFAVGGWSPLQRLSGMLTAHMTQIAPHNGFTWHPHRGLEIYTWVLEGTLYHEDTTGGKGEITAGEIQRMFSGHWIEHQELNPFDEQARVIQIWFAADPAYRDVEPHYQQASQAELPTQTIGDATIYSLIGDGSPLKQHMDGRLHATTLSGSTTVTAPKVGEDLFLYITDGTGTVTYGDQSHQLGQYDVILATPELQEAVIHSESPLHYLSFYLPSFLS